MKMGNRRANLDLDGEGGCDHLHAASGLKDGDTDHILYKHIEYQVGQNTWVIAIV
jgi:hypothetical protein